MLVFDVAFIFPMIIVHNFGECGQISTLQMNIVCSMYVCICVCMRVHTCAAIVSHHFFWCNTLPTKVIVAADCVSFCKITTKKKKKKR